MRVVGAGFGRTGTTSLKAALEELGFGPSYSLSEVFANPEHVGFWEAAGCPAGEKVDWEGFLAGYGVAVDWAGLLVLRRAHGSVPRGARDPDRPRSGTVVREHALDHLRAKEVDQRAPPGEGGLRVSRAVRSRRRGHRPTCRPPRVGGHLRRPLRGSY